MNPVDGTILSSYYMPSEAAQLYFDEMLWMYDQSDNTLKAYSPSVTRVSKGVDLSTPTSFTLSQNYPNPFNPTTSISFGLPAQSFVSLKVFDLIGKEVATLVSDELPAGNYTRQWNAADMPSGVYFYRLQAGSFNKTQRLILLK
jgi:Secretion system C-terminal sorting domain